MMSAFRGSSRGNPVWLLWLILGLTFLFIAWEVGSWFWLQRPVEFTERDLYGTWVSDGPHPTTLDFTKDGVVTISGAPLPQAPEDDDPVLSGVTEWKYFPDTRDPSVSVGGTYSQSLSAENSMFSTVLALYTGDPDSAGTRVVFRHTGG
ncbi:MULTISPECIES: hypothetical protein [unclassified Leifsonia]|uniref:hypothetical protein n=1 Tax=unclassified Leifsonia TaxID=2663824 RepID=UPI00037B5F64|nr:MULTISPECIES: hypothetical protein [unclassified Leifsonia]TDP99196.1 hypothetical protein AXZ95_3108 [Leifsonia sp. 115AMFTsu3.1]